MSWFLSWEYFISLDCNFACPCKLTNLYSCTQMYLLLLAAVVGSSDCEALRISFSRVFQMVYMTVTVFNLSFYMLNCI